MQTKSDVLVGILSMFVRVFTSPRPCRLKQLYRRQLSVPLLGNDEIFQEMQEAFSGDGAGFKAISQGHAKASEMVGVVFFFFFFFLLFSFLKMKQQA